MDESDLGTMTVSAATSDSASVPSECTPIKVFCRLRQQNQLEKREGAVQWYVLVMTFSIASEIKLCYSFST